MSELYPDRRIICVDARPHMLKESMREFDWSLLLGRGGFELFCPGADEGFTPPDDARIFMHPVLFGHDLEYYYRFLRLMRAPAPGGKLRVMSFMTRGSLVPHTLEDIHSTLREMGHDVHVVDLSGVSREREFDDAVRRGALDYCPDFVITVDAVGLSEEVLGGLGVPVVSWFFDNPLGILAFGDGEEGARPGLLGECYKVYSWDEYYVEPLESRGVRAEYLPLAANPSVFSRVECGGAEMERYGANVSFVGTGRRAADSEYRRGCVESLGGLGVKLWGDGWEDLRGGGFEFMGRADNRNETPKIFSSSKINLSFSTGQIVTGLPMRVFDILACGGFLLSDYRSDIDRLFGPGAGPAVFKSALELRGRVEYYLENPDERERIALAGRNAVLERHTFRHRMEKILRDTFGDDIDA